MVNEFLVGSIVGAISAIGGAYVAQRYQHILDVRLSHHADLTQTILEPWLKELARLSQFTGSYGLSHYGHPTRGGGYAFREGQIHNGMQIDTTHPLWPRAQHHWPEIASSWEELLNAFTTVDTIVGGLYRGLERTLGDPPPGIQWDFHDPRDPAFARRLAACASWDAYWQWTNVGKWDEHSREFLAKRQLTQGVDPSETFQVSLGAKLKDFFEDSHTRPKLQAAMAAAKSIQPKLDSLRERLLRVIHDRNVRGRCSFCPRFWSRRA